MPAVRVRGHRQCPGQHHDQQVRVRQCLLDLLDGEHLEACSLARAVGDAAHLGPEGAQQPGGRLPDSTETPHQRSGIKQGGQPLGVMDRLGPAQVPVPHVAVSGAYGLGQATQASQGQRQGVLGDGGVMEVPPGGDGD